LTIAVIGLEQRVLDDDLVPQIHEGIEEQHADVGQETGNAEELAHRFTPGKDCCSAVPAWSS
jgi:hypothetical protein